MATMSTETLDNRVEETREKNRRAVERAERRSASLERDVVRSKGVVERALEILRSAGYIK